MFVEGNPAPTFKFYWTKNDKEVEEGGRYKFMSDGDNNNMIALVITHVDHSDDGTYKLVIENCHGRDEAVFNLMVTGETIVDSLGLSTNIAFTSWNILLD